MFSEDWGWLHACKAYFICPVMINPLTTLWPIYNSSPLGVMLVQPCIDLFQLQYWIQLQQHFLYVCFYGFSTMQQNWYDSSLVNWWDTVYFSVTVSTLRLQALPVQRLGCVSLLTSGFTSLFWWNRTAQFIKKAEVQRFSWKRNSIHIPKILEWFLLKLLTSLYFVYLFLSGKLPTM